MKLNGKGACLVLIGGLVLVVAPGAMNPVLVDPTWSVSLAIGGFLLAVYVERMMFPQAWRARFVRKFARI